MCSKSLSIEQEKTVALAGTLADFFIVTQSLNHKPTSPVQQELEYSARKKLLLLPELLLIFLL
jgi:hypothetical protein